MTRPTLSPGLIAVLAALSAFAPLSIDMYLPALPTIARELGASGGDIQLTLTVFVLAFGFGQIVYGPIGDRYGRRPVILGALVVYVGASLACALAARADQLIALRLFQGLAACGGVVMARTMVRDLASGDQAARAMSLLMAASSLAPMAAPLIGGQVLALADWRAIFWVLAALGALAILAATLGAPETLHADHRQSLDPAGILRRFGELLKARAFVGPALTGGLQFAGLFCWLSGSPFVLIERYGVSPQDYGLIFAALISLMTLGSLLNARLAPRVGAARLLARAVWVPAGAGLTLAVLGTIEAMTGRIGLWPLMVPIAIQLACMSWIGPNAAALALQPYGHMAGSASSLMGVLNFGVGALFGTAVGQLLDGTVLPMALAMGTAGVLCLVAHRAIVRRAIA